MTDIPRLTDDELTTLARNIVTNVVYITNQPDAVDCSFGVMLRLAADTLPDIATIGAIYEDYAKANPLSVNGYPTFFSMRFVHMDDIVPLQAKIDAMRQALGL